MKYCLNSRQNKEYLDKADEIKVEYRDRDFIFELCEKYPEKTIILIHGIYDTDPLEWKTLKIVYWQKKIILSFILVIQ